MKLNVEEFLNKKYGKLTIISYKENCKWSTAKEQANNRKTNNRYTV